QRLLLLAADRHRPRHRPGRRLRRAAQEDHHLATLPERNIMSIARKSLAIVASVSLAMGLAACNRDSAGDGSVTLALSTQTNPFFVQLRDGAQAKADELGITLNIQDASDDASTQINQLNNAASSGADVVIVNPTDSDAVVPA